MLVYQRVVGKSQSKTWICRVDDWASFLGNPQLDWGIDVGRIINWHFFRGSKRQIHENG